MLSLPFQNTHTVTVSKDRRSHN